MSNEGINLLILLGVVWLIFSIIMCVAMPPVGLCLLFGPIAVAAIALGIYGLVCLGINIKENSAINTINDQGFLPLEDSQDNENDAEFVFSDHLCLNQDPLHAETAAAFNSPLSSSSFAPLEDDLIANDYAIAVALS